MPRYFPAERAEVLAAVRLLREERLIPGTSGNVSVRVKGGALVTPTGAPWTTLAEKDLVLVDDAGQPAPGQLQPTSEWRMHTDVYAARPEVMAVVHGHPRYTTALSCLREDLPAVHYMLAVAGADTVRCSAYATFGTEELSRAALTALGSSKACLLANHGILAVGSSLKEAVRVACEVERVADVYFHARLMGRPVLLDAAEMARVGEKFKTYGVQPGRKGR